MKKTITAILAATVIILSFLGPALFQVAQAADPSDWYMGKAGVLDSDYYSLYPFEQNSLTIGFSKFGEMVNPYTGNALNYSGRDPFANEGILQQYWLQGWVADVRYTHRVYGGRHIWASATYADLVVTGGDWINGATDPYGAPHGGRKTSGAAISDPIQVLYDGPREFVALLTTHLNDTTEGASWPVIDIMFTIIFNKVKKEVIVLKDIKLVMDQKILESPVNVQFSNRGEWDLGPSPNWKSYAHFYHQIESTCFNANWSLAKTILREYRFFDDSVTENQDVWIDIINDASVSPDPPWGLPIVPRSEYVYVNGVWQRPGIDYDINYTTGLIRFKYDLTADEVEIFFKIHKLDEVPMELPHEYDLAQVISSDLTHVGFAAFWPILSDYTVDGWDRALDPLIVANEPDMMPVPSEPDIPYVVGEWDFMLDFDEATEDFGPQFRGVTVYGLVNYHDADDAQGDDLNDDTVVENQVDIEVQYQLDEVFNPWDLQQAVHKKTNRWVEFYDVTESDYDLAQLGADLEIYLDHTPVLKAPVWEEYCSFSERVLWDGELKYPNRSVYTAYDYELYVNATTGIGYIWIDDDDVPAAGTEIKILYSTKNVTLMGRYEWIEVGRIAASVDSAGAALVSAAFKNKQVEIGIAGLDMWDPVIANQIPWVMRKFGTGDAMVDYHYDYAGGDHRTALRDDWCTTWPVASSNMIGVGGPLANVLAWYGNDFTAAFFGVSMFTDYTPWENKIAALTCWNKNAYASDEDTGYAMIGTYKDINGTVLLLVWGHWGRDTYYATKWFHEEGIYQLQEAPLCLTSIILEIDYTVHEPEVSIVECLGTISETEWVHDYDKGGIHDC